MIFDYLRRATKHIARTARRVHKQNNLEDIVKTTREAVNTAKHYAKRARRNYTSLRDCIDDALYRADTLFGVQNRYAYSGNTGNCGKAYKKCKDSE